MSIPADHDPIQRDTHAHKGAGTDGPSKDTSQHISTQTKRPMEEQGRIRDLVIDAISTCVRKSGPSLLARFGVVGPDTVHL